MDTEQKQKHVEIFTWRKSKQDFELPPTHMVTFIFQRKTDCKSPQKSSDIVSLVVGAWSH